MALVAGRGRRARSGCSSGRARPPRSRSRCVAGVARGDGLRARRRRCSGSTRCCRWRSASSPSSSGWPRPRPCSTRAASRTPRRSGASTRPGSARSSLRHPAARDGRDGARGARGRVPGAAGVRDRIADHRSLRRVVDHDRRAPLPAGHRPLRDGRGDRDVLRRRTARAGLTTNAITSVSLEPLLLLVCFDNASRTLPARARGAALRRERARAPARTTSRACSPPSGSRARSSRPSPTWTPTACRCSTARSRGWRATSSTCFPAGDHTIGIGEITHMDSDPGGEPLVWFRGAYGTFAAEEAAPAVVPGRRCPAPTRCRRCQTLVDAR